MTDSQGMSKNFILNNRYQLQKEEGSGGMALVYKARDTLLERDVAIKILRKDFSNNPDFQERFRQEAKAAANLYHRNIVTVHDFGFDRDFLFIVMEYIAGNTLKRLIHKRGRLFSDIAIQLMIQACDGVGYAHRAGLVHCDIKPQNILVTPDQRVKVTDFGIARALESIREDEQASVVWGSPQYFSPEQARGKAPSPASDVYSLGVILFEMLTGQLPFSANTPNELSRQHLHSPPPEPKELNPAISEELNRIVLKVLSKEPAARYRTADQLGSVLKTFSERTDQFRFIQSRSQHAEEPKTQPFPHSASRQSSETTPFSDELEPVDNKPWDLDWVTIGLGILALLFVGGLIPFWVWVYFSLLGQ